MGLRSWLQKIKDKRRGQHLYEIWLMGYDEACNVCVDVSRKECASLTKAIRELGIMRTLVLAVSGYKENDEANT